MDPVLTHEPHLRIEVAADVSPLDPPVRVLAVVREVEVPGCGLAGDPRILCPGVETGRPPLRRQAHARVRPEGPRVFDQRVVGGAIDVREEGAYVGRVPKILLDPAYEEVCAWLA